MGGLMEHRLWPHASSRTALAVLLSCWLASAASVPRLSTSRAVHLAADRANTTAVGGLPAECRAGIRVNSASDKWEQCPAECPLYVKDKGDGMHCDFACVKDSVAHCVSGNPDTPVVDDKLGVCRDCKVLGCSICKGDGTDTCAECSHGYTLQHGKCLDAYWWVWVLIFGTIGFGAAVAGIWMLELACRTVTNDEGLRHGLSVRSRAKLHMPKEVVPEHEAHWYSLGSSTKGSDQPRMLWPLSTNLCNTPVAGAGVVLSFNFQAFLILWSAIIFITWVVFAYSTDDELLRLGTHRAVTERQNCILVFFGYETQQRLMWTKVAFLSWCYIFTFVGSILFSIRQLRMFQIMDEKATTHQDFAATLIGLPRLGGEQKVERLLKDAVHEATHLKVVGVSVCWDMASDEDDLLAVIENELEDRDDGSEPDDVTTQEPVPPGILRRATTFVEHFFLAPSTQKVLTKGRQRNIKPRHHNVAKNARALGGSDEEPAKVVDAVAVLKSLKTCDKAFVVFQTEQARDAAVEQITLAGGLAFQDACLGIEKTTAEPDSVLWHNMHNMDRKARILRILTGVVMVCVALFMWVFFFYLPYAYFAMGYNYAHGEAPGIIEVTMFSLVVVAGNVIMYFVCSEVSDRVGFHTAGDRETCYLLLYTAACVFNVALDLVCSYYVAFYMMVGVGMKSYHGVPLEDVETFAETFETYAMQRELGHTLMAYCFPATFLIPFLIEPIATIYAPWKLMSWIVGSHPEMQGPCAEMYLASIPFDLSRYADVLLNVMLAVMIFFFPAGFTAKMFFGLVLSHVFIYCYDQYRVLRTIPACDFASMRVDWWAQWMLSIPCGILLSALAFKANCENYAQETVADLPGVGTHLAGAKFHLGQHDISYCDGGFTLVLKCGFWFFLHVALHTLVLSFLVPKCGRKEKEASDEHYEVCSKRIACSWFSANPVNCLRSAWIYRDHPPADFCIAGKEHLIRPNGEVTGVYFEDRKAAREDYTFGVNRQALSHLFGKRHSAAS